MSIASLATQFVELCNQGKNFDVMEKFYAPEIISVEGTGHETAGKGPVIEKSRKWAAANTIHSEKVRGPFFSGQTQFAVHFTFEVTPKETNQKTTLEEVAVYTVNKDDQITKEQFYYAGKW